MEHDKLELLKGRLSTELATVEGELASIGKPSTRAGMGWETELKEADIDSTATEPDEKADRFEDLEAHEYILNALARRLAELKRALQKIDDGSYGTCEVGGEPIEEARLEANPAARTCEKHIDDEKNLPQ